MTPPRTTSSRWIVKNTCEQKQTDTGHAEHFIITYYKSVH